MSEATSATSPKQIGSAGLTGLTDEQVSAYWRDGYVIVRGLFDETTLAPWRERVRDLATRRVPPSPNMTLVRDVMFAKGAAEPLTPEHEICKINFFENDPVLATYANHPGLLDCIEALLGPELLFVNSMVITKPPGVDGRHPLHQDLLYFGFRPGDALVGTWTALEEVNRDNGGLSVLPRSHRGTLLEHDVPDWDYVNAGFFGANNIDPNAERVHVEMNAGDTLLFHSQLLHGSGTNRTDRFRRAISTHYVRTTADDLWNGKDVISNRPWIPVRAAAQRPES
ncbi:MAG: phytanoyl-CoA hydroxylase [Hyphomicrobiaceae bacterium]|jgi:phytanoyl-CoA hydroxylase